jgi:hypothetical protein
MKTILRRLQQLEQRHSESLAANDKKRTPMASLLESAKIAFTFSATDGFVRMMLIDWKAP